MDEAQPDDEEPAGARHRLPVPVVDLLPLARAGGRRPPYQGGAAGEAALSQEDRDGDRSRARVLRGGGLSPAVPREARSLELHGRVGRDEGLTRKPTNALAGTRQGVSSSRQTVMHPGWTTAPVHSTPPSPERSARSLAASCSWPAAGCRTGL